MIWASVAPPFRWSSPRTVAFLLPSRAVAALAGVFRPALAGAAGLAGVVLAALVGFPLAASLAFLAGFRAAAAADLVGADVSAGLPPSRLWMAFQIRATADVR